MHSIVCPETEPKLYRCTVGPISGKDRAPYRVTVASDSSDPPKIIATEQDVDFVSAEQAQQLTREQQRNIFFREIQTVVSIAAAMFVVLTAVEFLLRRFIR